MSEPTIFEQCMDEHGNISVRVSHDVQVLTREEADRIKAEYKRMQDENVKLQERVDTLEWLLKLTLRYAEEGELSGHELCDLCDRLGTCENHPATSCTRTFDTTSDFIRDRMRELGVEVVE
jgi:hypothetical protein